MVWSGKSLSSSTFLRWATSLSSNIIIRHHTKNYNLAISMWFAIQRKSSFTSQMDTNSLKLLMLFSLMALVRGELSKSDARNTLASPTEPSQPTILNKQMTVTKKSNHSKKHSSDAEEFENVLLEYVGDVVSRDKIDIMPGIYIEKTSAQNISDVIERRSTGDSLIWRVKDFVDTHALRVDLARATTETGRLFFFKGKSRWR